MESRGARRGKRRAARADRRAGDRARRRRPAARGAGDMRARGLGLRAETRSRSRQAKKAGPPAVCAARQRAIHARRARPPRREPPIRAPPGGCGSRRATAGGSSTRSAARATHDAPLRARRASAYAGRLPGLAPEWRWTRTPCARPGDINRLELTREQPGALRPADQPRALGLAAVEPAGRGACGGAAGDLAQRERLGIRHAVPRLTAHPLQRSPRAATVVTMNPRFFSAASAGAVVHHDLARRRARPGPRDETRRRLRVPILMYHYVSERPKTPTATGSICRSRRSSSPAQLRWLRAMGTRAFR